MKNRGKYSFNIAKRLPIVNSIKDRFEEISLKAKNITLPFFDNLPLYDVALFFIKGLNNGAMKTRAAAIAYNTILVLFPSILVLFTLIPFIPIDGFQDQLIDLISDFIPDNAFIALQSTINDIITQPNGGFLSIGFFTAIVFASNGIDSLISAFNASAHTVESRTWLEQRLSAIMLGLVMILLIGTGAISIIISEVGIKYLLSANILKQSGTISIIIGLKWIIVTALLFFGTASIFYLAPSSKSRLRFISAGGTVATILIIIISLGFSFYINNFGKYNTLYGSIGTLIGTMLWLYFNAFALLIGFELNGSISSVRVDSKNRQPKEKKSKDR